MQAAQAFKSNILTINRARKMSLVIFPNSIQTVRKMYISPICRLVCNEKENNSHPINI